MRFETKPNGSFYEVNSIEGQWNTGSEEPGGNLSYKPRTKQGYFPVPPMDHYQDLRSDMSVALHDVGIEIVNCQSQRESRCDVEVFASRRSELDQKHVFGQPAFVATENRTDAK